MRTFKPAGCIPRLLLPALLAVAGCACFAAAEGSLAELQQAATKAAQQHDHAAVIRAATRYFKDGGSTPAMRQLLIQAYIGAQDWANAARELQAELRAAELEGRVADEEALLQLQRCYQQLGDADASAWVLERLLAHHPRKAYWRDLLARMSRRADLGQPLALDLLRLRFATGTMETAADYEQLAQFALQAGHAAEARRVVEAGFASGLLGQGARADEQRRMRDAVLRTAADERRRLALPETETAAQATRSGLALLQLGMALVGQGDTARGLALMERGMAIGNLGDRPQYAKLHLGIAYVWAGQRGRAADIFRTVTGIHGAADLARLWGLYAAG